MNKSTLIHYIYVLCCELAEEKVMFGISQQILSKFLNNDISFLEDLPEVVSEGFTNTCMEVQDNLNLLTDVDINIIVQNLLKELYLMLEYTEKSYDYSLSYRERDIAKYKSTLKEVSIKVLMTYLESGTSLKDEFSSFKDELKKYASEHIGIIANMLDTNDTKLLNDKLVERRSAAKSIIQKYPVFNFINIRSSYENDKFIKTNSMKMAV